MKKLLNLFKKKKSVQSNESSSKQILEDSKQIPFDIEKLKKETWDVGLPMILQDGDGKFYKVWKNGKIEEKYFR